MSMPYFPEHGLNITQEQAFNMLLASIAMEELSLSHIMNAEGEKLQYVLGTLPGSPGTCATTDELLAVNKSITNLLDSVMQNQIMLKGKLERILESKDQCCKPHDPCRPHDPCEPFDPCRPHDPCDPVDPCDPIDPCKPPVPCKPYNPYSPVSTPCGNVQEYMTLSSGRESYCWKSQCPFPWKCCHKAGNRISWSESKPSIIRLSGGSMYDVSFRFSFKNCVNSEVCIYSQDEKGCAPLPLQSFKCCGNSLVGSAVFTVAECQNLSLFFSLCKPERVCVTQACVTILPI